MTDQERILVLFEAIEKQLESIAKAIKDLPKTSSSPADNSSIDIVNKLIADFTDKLREMKVTIPSQAFQPIESKLIELKEDIKKISTPIKAEIIRTEHYFFFFPDLKTWLHQLERAKFIWILAALLTGSLLINFYIWKDYGSYKDSDLKYRYLRNFGGPGLVDTIGRLDYSLLTKRQKVVDAVEHRENLVKESIDKERRIQDLKKELDSLELKKSKK